MGNVEDIDNRWESIESCLCPFVTKKVHLDLSEIYQIKLRGLDADVGVDNNQQ